MAQGVAPEPGPSARKRAFGLGLGLLAAVLVFLPIYDLLAERRRAREFVALDVDADALRIYLLGGSTPLGAPYVTPVGESDYLPYADFGLIASLMFENELQGRPIEVINRAKSARDSAAAANQARGIVRFGKQHASSVALVYSGNNEFLKFDQVHDLTQMQRRLFDEPVLPLAQHAAVMRDYEANLERIVTLLHDVGTFVVLSTIAVNLADWEPNRSVLGNGANEERVRELFASAAAHQARGAEGPAEADYRRVTELEPTFAWGWWLLAQGLRARGAFDEARAAYTEALRFDARPDRGTPAHNDIVRRVAHRHGVPLIDAQALFEQAAVDGLPGYDLFWDNCHPRLAGHLLVATAFAELLEQRYGTPRTRSSWSPKDLEGAFEIHTQRRLAILSWEASYHYVTSIYVFDPTRRLAQAERLLDEGFALRPGDSGLLFSRGIVAALRDELDHARDFWQRAHAADPEVYQERLNNPSVRQILARQRIHDPLGER